MIDVLLVFISCIVLMPVLVFAVQVFSAIKKLDYVMQELNNARPSAAVLVPAHNEASVIASTLTALMPQLGNNDRLLVVADNCEDETATIARTIGAEVIERTDSDKRGKGFALDFGLRYLNENPSEVLIIVDADCQVGGGAIDKLIISCVATGRPIQALYLMHAPENAGLKLRIAEFAWRVKNHVRPLGAKVLGLPCQLMGTGMAFPWSLTQKMNLASDHIVEDMKLGVDLAIAGSPPIFCPEALVNSEFPSDSDAVASQRTRWEHGHLGVIFHEFPRLFFMGIFRANFHLVGMALDLMVPPLSLLSGMLVLNLAITTVSVIFGLSILPLLLALTSSVLFGVAVGVAWRGWGKDVVTLMELFSIPLYILGKIPIYLRFLTRRQKEWVKTDRK